MDNWTPEQWTIFAGAVTLVLGGVATATVKIIEAVNSVKLAIKDNEDASAQRLERAQGASRERHKETAEKLETLRAEIKNGDPR